MPVAGVSRWLETRGALSNPPGRPQGHHLRIRPAQEGREIGEHGLASRANEAHGDALAGSAGAQHSRRHQERGDRGHAPCGDGLLQKTTAGAGPRRTSGRRCSHEDTIPRCSGRGNSFCRGASGAGARQFSSRALQNPNGPALIVLPKSIPHDPWRSRAASGVAPSDTFALGQDPRARLLKARPLRARP